MLSTLRTSGKGVFVFTSLRSSLGDPKTGEKKTRLENGVWKTCLHFGRPRFSHGFCGTVDSPWWPGNETLLLVSLSQMWTPLTPVLAYTWYEGQLLPMELLARCFLQVPGNIYHGLFQQ